MSHFLGDHTKFLKVDQAFHFGIVPQIDESQIFLYHREERYLQQKVHSVKNMKQNRCCQSNVLS